MEVHFEELDSSMSQPDSEGTIVQDRSTLGVRLVIDAKYSCVACLFLGRYITVLQSSPSKTQPLGHLISSAFGRR